MTRKGLLSQLLLKLEPSQKGHCGHLMLWMLAVLLAFAAQVSATPPATETKEVTIQQSKQPQQAARASGQQISKDENIQPVSVEANAPVDTETAQHWLFLHPYKATYAVSSSGDKLGSATRELTYTAGRWRLSMRSKLSAYLLSLKSQESSSFSIAADEFMLQSFESSTKITFKKKRQVKQTFDWDKKIESGRRGSKKWQLPLTEPVYDRTSHILKLREDLINGERRFSYLISYKGKRKHYDYQKQKIETITTGYGKYEAVKMVRTAGDDSEFAIWLSPELNYFPVRIAQFEQDKPDVVMNLSSLEFLPYQQPIALAD